MRPWTLSKAPPRPGITGLVTFAFAGRPLRRPSHRAECASHDGAVGPSSLLERAMLVAMLAAARTATHRLAQDCPSDPERSEPSPRGCRREAEAALPPKLAMPPLCTIQAQRAIAKPNPRPRWGRQPPCVARAVAALACSSGTRRRAPTAAATRQLGLELDPELDPERDPERDLERELTSRVSKS